MIRTCDPLPFAKIASDPSVAPWIGGQLTPELVANPDNICLLTDERDGGYILHHLQPGLYAAHTLALPSARGKQMYRLMQDGFAYLFLETDCIEVVTQCPDGNKSAASWADLAGFREIFTRKACFPLKGELVDSSFRSIRYEDWVLRHLPNRDAGREFHEFMDAARDQSGTEIHAQDDIHDAYVGATLGCARAGNILKGAGLYNRFAVQAGYHTMTVLSVNPVVCDIGDAVLSLQSGDLQILQVR